MRARVCETPIVGPYRLTIPAREALEAGGNHVRPSERSSPSLTLWDVVLERPVPGLVLVLVGHGPEQSLALRRTDEPRWPGEWSDGGGVSCWDTAQVQVGCPRCGATLVWYEAGYVPGTRLCLYGHGAQLSMDCASARPMRVALP